MVQNSMKLITRKNISVWICLLVIFLFAFIPRYLSVNEGLPYIPYWDEPKCIVGALNGIKNDEIKSFNQNQNRITLIGSINSGVFAIESTFPGNNP